MKTNLISKLMILSGVCVLSACSGKGGDNNTANAVGPQGRIMSLNSQNTYCDISAGTISCTSQDPQSGQMCKTQQKLYNPQDMGNFCQKIHELKYESLLGYGACDASSALDRILNENCKGIATPGMPNPVPNNPGNPNPGYPGNPNPGYPGQPGCPGMGCGPGPGYPGQPVPVQPIAFMHCDIRVNDEQPVRFPLAMGGAPSTAEYKLKPPGFFGFLKKSVYKVYLKYNPNNRGNRTMYIKVTHNDKKRKVLIEQTGNASQPVSLSAIDNGDVVAVNCAGQHQPVPVNEAAAPKTNLVCHGFSDTLSGGGRPEQIDVNKPLNQILEGEELQLSSAVRIVIDKSKLNITYKALLDDTFGPDLQATSSLKSPAVLISSEGLSKATVQCSLK